MRAGESSTRVCKVWILPPRPGMKSVAVLGHFPILVNQPPSSCTSHKPGSAWMTVAGGSEAWTVPGSEGTPAPSHREGPRSLGGSQLENDRPGPTQTHEGGVCEEALGQLPGPGDRAICSRAARDQPHHPTTAYSAGLPAPAQSCDQEGPF